MNNTLISAIAFMSMFAGQMVQASSDCSVIDSVSDSGTDDEERIVYQHHSHDPDFLNLDETEIDIEDLERFEMFRSLPSLGTESDEGSLPSLLSESMEVLDLDDDHVVCLIPSFSYLMSVQSPNSSTVGRFQFELNRCNEQYPDDHLDLKMIPNWIQSLQMGRNKLKSISDWSDLEGTSLTKLSLCAGRGGGNGALKLDLTAFTKATNQESRIPLKRLDVSAVQIAAYFGSDGKGDFFDSLIPKIRNWVRCSTLEELRVLNTEEGPIEAYSFYKDGTFGLHTNDRFVELEEVISTSPMVLRPKVHLTSTEGAPRVSSTESYERIPCTQPLTQPVVRNLDPVITTPSTQGVVDHSLRTESDEGSLPSLPIESMDDTVVELEVLHLDDDHVVEQPVQRTFNLIGRRFPDDHFDLKRIPNGVKSLQMGRNKLKSISDWSDLEGTSLTKLSLCAGRGGGNGALRLDLEAFLKTTNQESFIPLQSLKVSTYQIADYFGSDKKRDVLSSLIPKIRNWIQRSTLQQLVVQNTNEGQFESCIFYKDGSLKTFTKNRFFKWEGPIPCARPLTPTDTYGPIPCARPLTQPVSRNLSPNPVITAPLTQGPVESPPHPLREAAAPSPILNVWNWNLDENLQKMLNLLEEYPFIAVDSEFPGKLFEDGNGYDLMRRNVNALKVIQLGFTLFNEKGESPKPHSTFQFNFRFDVSSDPFNQESLQFLQENSGIDFAVLSRFGIRHSLFAERLRGSNLIRNPDLRWLCFHGIYDFGYLVKMLSSRNLPGTESEFVQSLHREFPFIFDLKLLRLNVDEVSHFGGLQQLANELGVVRVGQAHQAGSDAQLTGNVFFTLRERFFEEMLAAGGCGHDGQSLYELGEYTSPDRECRR